MTKTISQAHTCNRMSGHTRTHNASALIAGLEKGTALRRFEAAVDELIVGTDPTTAEVAIRAAFAKAQRLMRAGQFEPRQ